MSSNVGLSTPRGSGTSGYVQRNSAFMKARSAPYPPVSVSSGSAERPFKQRMPDRQILEHDRRRAVEVRVMEERERLEEENERIEEGQRGEEKGGEEEGEEGEENVGVRGRVLSEEEIEERCEALRVRLLREMEEGEGGSGSGSGDREMGRVDKHRNGRGKMGPPRDRRQIKAYQVHELAEAKIEESERLRRALGIREDRETGEISSRRGERRVRD